MPRVPFRSLFYQKTGSLYTSLQVPNRFGDSVLQCTHPMSGLTYEVIWNHSHWIYWICGGKGLGAKYNPKLTNLQCLRKQNLGLSTQGKTIVNGGRKKRDLSSTTQCFLIILQRNTLLSPGTAPSMVPIWGTMGTKMSFLVPIFFSKSPFSPFHA